VDLLHEQKGYAALCHYAENYPIPEDKIKYLQEKYSNTPQVVHIISLWRNREKMSRLVLKLEVLEVLCADYVSHLDEHLRSMSRKDAFKKIQQLQEEYEDAHVDVIAHAEIFGICTAHMKKMHYLIEKLHDYYNVVVARLIQD